MIDTINITIHDLSLHQDLTSYLYEAYKEKGLSKLATAMNSDDEVSIENRIRFKNQTRFHETGEEVETMYYNKLPSHAYDVSYRINFLKDTIEINVSIPKWKYGTNTFMLLPDIDTHEYAVRRGMELKDLLKSGYQDFKTAIKDFFRIQFPDMFIEPRAVEITQVHFCFNYVMNDEQEVIEVIEQLRRNKKKHFRQRKGQKNIYETGIYFPAKYFTFKIYAKGAEFRRNDKKKLVKFNKELGRNFYAVKTIESLANKTLRFELEVRKLGLNYLFKHKVYRKNDRWKEIYWKAVQSAVRTGSYNFPEGKTGYHELAPKKKQAVKFFERVLNGSFAFMLKNDSIGSFKSDDKKEIFESRDPGSLVEMDQAFDKRLWNECVRKFYDLCIEFSPKYINNVFEISKGFETDKKRDENLMKAHKVQNKDTETSGLSIDKMHKLLEWLEKYSFQEIEEMGIMGKRTLYRYMAYLSKYGVEKNSQYAVKEYYLENNILNYDDFIKENFVYLNNCLHLHSNIN